MFSTTLQKRQPLASRLLQAAAQRSALANAYLFSGPSCPDKQDLALQLAAALNCSNRPDATALGSCLSLGDAAEERCLNCKWIGDGEHPQAWIVLRPEADKTKVAVEKARSLCEELLKSSAFFRVMVIPQAEQQVFHDAPANALLKSIEEPGARCLFVLFASHADTVLPTIVSRCQVIEVSGSYRRGLMLSDCPQDCLAVLEDHRQQFLQEFAGAVKVATTMRSGSLKYVVESRAISDRLIKLAEEYRIPGALVIDAYVSADFDSLKESALVRPETLSYLNKLFSAAETAKQELDHYVKLNNVVEKFVYSVWDLRSLYSGELSVAITKN